MSATRTPSPERDALVALLRPLVLEIMQESRETLETLRIGKGWTQAQLARESGVCRDTISRIEQGRGRVLIATVAALAGALGMDHERVAGACRRGSNAATTRTTKHSNAVCQAGVPAVREEVRQPEPE